MNTKEIYKCEKSFTTIDYRGSSSKNDVKVEGIRVRFFQPMTILKELVIDDIFSNFANEKNVRVVRIISAPELIGSFIDKIILHLCERFPKLEMVSVDGLVKFSNWFDECNNEFQIEKVGLCSGSCMVPYVDGIIFSISESNGAINSIEIVEPNSYINFQEKGMFAKIYKSTLCEKSLKFVPSALLGTVFTWMTDHANENVRLQDMSEQQKTDFVEMINTTMNDLLTSENLNKVVVDLKHKINKDLADKYGMNYFNSGDKILLPNRSCVKLVVKTIRDNDGCNSNRIVLKTLSILLPTIKKLKIKSGCSDMIINNSNELRELFYHLVTLKIKANDLYFLNASTFEAIKKLNIKVVVKCPRQKVDFDGYFPRNLKTLSVVIKYSLENTYDNLIEHIQNISDKLKEPLRFFSLTFTMICTHKMIFDEEGLILCLKKITSIFQNKTTKMEIVIINILRYAYKHTNSILESGMQFDNVLNGKNILRKLDLVQKNGSVYNMNNRSTYYFHENDYWSFVNYSPKTERNSGTLMSFLCSLKVFCKKYMIILPKPVLLTIILPNMSCHMLKKVAEMTTANKNKRKINTL